MEKHKRGPKTVEMSIVPGDVDHLRPEPLDWLSDGAAEEWRLIVGRMPAEWFTAETWPLLAALCHHVAEAKEITIALKDYPLNSRHIKMIKIRATLNKMLITEHKIIVNIATRLRLTPQSKYDATKARKKFDKEPSFRPSFAVDISAA